MTRIDLSQPYESGMQVYPDDPPVDLDPHTTHAADGYRVTRVSMGSHSGTHVDAPSHTETDGRSLDEFPIGTFAFDAAHVSLPDLDPRQPIEVEALVDAPDCDLLVLETGWDARWNTSAYLDHPYLAPEAARWLADNDYHVGIDALSVDPTPCPNAGSDEPAGVPAHHALLGTDHLIVENLTGLAVLPERFILHAYPLALAGADGAPIRAVAQVTETALDASTS